MRSPGFGLFVLSVSLIHCKRFSTLSVEMGMTFGIEEGVTAASLKLLNVKLLFSYYHC